MDILFAQTPELGETGTGNCFEKNKPAGFTYFSTEGVLPTDGCKTP